jgi:response regulator RpfG family c-di-GMP phosphodiesterase
MFEPDFMTKDQSPGKGLGLSLVQDHIDKNGGFISVFSEIGKGTVIKIHLPAVPKPRHLTQATSSEKPILGKETILLVEDEKALLETARKILTRYGYKVLSTENSSEAITMYKKYIDRIDLILLNAVIPGVETAKVLSWFKKINPKVKIIATASLGDRRTVETEFSQAVAGFIQKPFQVRPLLRKVRTVLNA